jgi:hypothetical protein
MVKNKQLISIATQIGKLIIEPINRNHGKSPRIPRSCRKGQVSNTKGTMTFWSCRQFGIRERFQDGVHGEERVAAMEISNDGNFGK